MILRRAVLLAPLMSLPLWSPTPAEACGLGTHGELTQRARTWFDPTGLSLDYGALIARQQASFQAGAPFPDWGYACGYGDAAEDTHWQPFIRIAAQYIHDTYPQPWDAETEKTVAWLLGVTAHSISDISWHGLGVSEGFIDVMSDQEFHGDWGTAHTYADTGGDFVAAREVENDWLIRKWEVPIDDIMAIYALAGRDVSERRIDQCVKLLFLGTFAEDLAGTLVFPYFAQDTPFLVERYLDYFVGGLDDMAIWTSWAWYDVIDWMEGGASQSGSTYWATWRRAPGGRTASQNHDAHDPSVDLAHALGLEASVRREGRHLVIELDPASIPSDVRARLEDVHRRRADGHDLSWAVLGASAESPAAKSAREEARWGEAPRLGERGQAPAFTGTAPMGYLGRALATGDYDGDGSQDLAMGAYGLGGAGVPQDGGVFVTRGGAPSEPMELPGDGINGWTLLGGEEYGRFGWSLATVDLNADGYDDLAVGAPTVGARTMGYQGRVYVYLGGPRGLDSEPVEIVGSGTYTNFGWRVRSGDVDGDGSLDLLVGSPFARAGGTQRGVVQLFLASRSRAAGQTLTQSGADWSRAGATDWDWFGYELTMAVIPNQGRYLLVGAPGADQGSIQTTGRIEGWNMTDAGEGYFPTSPSFSLSGVSEWDKVGASFAFGAPFPDRAPVLALAAPTRTVDEKAQAGWVGLFDLAGLSGATNLANLPAVTAISGDQWHARLGWSIAFGDEDGDGVEDLLLSEPLRRTPAGFEGGAVHLWRGGAAFPVGESTGARATADETWVGEEGQSRLGETLHLGDLDGDGAAEVILAAHRSSRATDHGGAVYIPTAGTRR